MHGLIAWKSKNTCSIGSSELTKKKFKFKVEAEPGIDVLSQSPWLLW